MNRQRSLANFFPLMLAVSLLMVALWGVSSLYLPGTALEELQAGGIASNILFHGRVELEFAITNLTAALGFYLLGFDLVALRSGFIFLGGLAWALFCLSSLESSRYPISLGWGLFALSTTPLIPGVFLHADEICAGFSLGLLVFAVIFRMRVNPTPLQLLTLSVLVGAMLYEYSAYKFLALFFAGLIALDGYRVLNQKLIHVGLLCVAFSFTLIAIVVAPLVLDITQAGLSSSFFDGVRRHWGEVSGLADVNAFSRTIQYLRYIFGYGIVDGKLSAQGIAIMPMLLSHSLLGFGLYAARRDIRARCCLAHTFLAPLCAGVLAHNVELLRMLPALLTLIVAGIIGVSEFFENSTGRSRQTVVVIVAGIITLTNLSRMQVLAAASEIREAHAHDQYPMCELLAKVRPASGHPLQVLIFDSFGGCHQEGDSAWLVGKPIAVRQVQEFAQLEADYPTPIIFTRHYGLSTAQVAAVESWAQENCKALTWYRDLAGRLFAGVTESRTEDLEASRCAGSRKR